MALKKINLHPGIRLCEHASLRKNQRGFSDEGVYAALTWGHVYTQGASRKAYHINKKSVTKASLNGEDIQCFLHLVVVLSKDNVVITTYKAKKVPYLRGSLHLREKYDFNI